MADEDGAPLSAFDREIKFVLEHAFAPDEVGAASALASPFFLGHRLPVSDAPADDRTRGEALIRLLRQMTEAVEPRDLRELLHAYGFDRAAAPRAHGAHLRARLTNAQLAAELHMSERKLYRDRDLAVQRLAMQLILRHHPHLAAEQPAAGNWSARPAAAGQLAAWLHARESVSLIGPSGVGKTSLAVTVTAGLGAPGVFWFTVRPGLNDDALALMHSLAFFCQTLGRATLWQHLLVAREPVPFDRLLGLLRAELRVLPSGCVFVIDEADLLDDGNARHAQVIEVIEVVAALDQAPALLVVGQRSVLHTRHTRMLSGLEPAELDAWLSQQRLTSIDATAREALQQRSAGNPGVLMLYAALHHSGVDVALALSRPEAPTADVLFGRVARRLSSAQRHLMEKAALSGSPLPVTALGGSQADVAYLENMGLVVRTQNDGIIATPFLRPAIDARLSSHERALLHGELALVHERFASRIAAMHHWLGAHQPAMAVWLWAHHQAHELQRGNSVQALVALESIDPASLGDARDRDMLHLCLGTLLTRAGRADLAEARLIQVSGSQSHDMAARRDSELGRALAAQSRVTQALDRYRASLDHLDHNLVGVRMHTRHRIVSLYKDALHDLPNAALVARQMLMDALTINANVAVHQGNVDRGLQQFIAAEELAVGGDECRRELAVCLSGHASALWQVGRVDQAIEKLERSIGLHHELGFAMDEVNDRNTLCAAFIAAGRLTEAAQTGASALAAVEPMNHPLLLSVICANLAEAHAGLGQYDVAEAFVMRALGAEELRFRSVALTALAMIRRGQGRPIEARAALREALDAAIEVHDQFAEAAALRLLAES